jgi:hypothetical protein
MFHISLVVLVGVENNNHAAENTIDLLLSGRILPEELGGAALNEGTPEYAIG